MSMNVPRNGRAVVIDDSVDEALPLVKVLAKNGVPVTYFTGEREELPKQPLGSVRIVFLDLKLVPSMEPKMVVSALVNTLRKIVGTGNGPYFIILWSKNESEYLKAFKNRFNDKGGLENIKPLAIISLEKNTYLEYNGEDRRFKKDAMHTIEKKLKEKLRELGIFHLFIIWENLVHRASGEIVNDFSKFHPYDGAWNRNMGNIFIKLSEGFAGKQLPKANTDHIIRNLLLSFNGAFMDTLESEIALCHVPDAGISFSSVTGSVSEDIIGDINSKLLIAIEEDSLTLPGNVYARTSFRKKEVNWVDIRELTQNLDSYARKRQMCAVIRHVALETSPICDYTQDKWRVSRLLPGILYPREDMKKIKKADFIYKSPLLKYANRLYRLVFDLRYFTSVKITELTGKTPLFRIKQPLLVDIQSKLASHVNRPGVMFVE